MIPDDGLGEWLPEPAPSGKVWWRERAAMPEPLTPPGIVLTVMEATRPDGRPGLRLGAWEAPAGQRWLHTTILPDTEASQDALLALALNVASAFSKGWRPSPPLWRV